MPKLTMLRAEWTCGQSSTGVTIGIGNAAWELPPGRTAIWFLQQAGSHWRILPLATGTVPLDELYILVPNGELPAADLYDSATDLSKKLMLELKAAAFDPKTSDAIARLAVLGMLDDGLGAGTLQAFDAALASSSQTIPRAIGLAGEIRAGQPGSMATLASISWSTLPSIPLIMLMRSVCAYRGTDASGIPELAILAESAPLPRMQECAAHALREVHTKEALPFLRKLLDHPNGTIRYDAMIGIAQFAMNFPLAKAGHKIEAMENYKAGPDVTQEINQHYPAMDLFAKDEGEYISYWKAWLDNHPVE